MARGDATTSQIRGVRLSHLLLQEGRGMRRRCAERWRCRRTGGGGVTRGDATVEARLNDSIQIANLTLEIKILIELMSQGSLLRDGKNSMEFSFSVATSGHEWSGREWSGCKWK
jgi:hypothetical protein